MRSKSDHEKFIESAKGNEQERAERHIVYPLRLPESLNLRLREYADNHGKKGESLNAIINRALETELDRLDIEIGNQERLLAKGRKVEQKQS